MLYISRIMSSNDTLARLATDRVQVAPSYFLGKVLKRALKASVLVVFVVAIVYSVVLVPTIVRVVPTEDFGLVLTRDPTIVDGGIPAGKTEVVSFSSKAGYMRNVKGKLQAAFTFHTDTSKMMVVEGPNGRLLEEQDGSMSFNGEKMDSEITKPVNYSVLEDSKWYLTDQYLMRCLEGSCRPGRYYIVSEDSVIGEIKSGDSEPLINQIKNKAASSSRQANAGSKADGSSGGERAAE